MTLLAPIAYCLALAIPGQQTTHSLGATTLRVSDLMPVLSKELGLPLECTSAVANDVVLIRFKDASTVDVLNRLAAVTFASWTKNGAGYRLVRTSASLRASAGKIETEERAKLIVDALKSVASQEARAPAWNQAAASALAKKYFDAIEGMRKGNRSPDPKDFEASPATRALNQLLLLIGANQLATIRPGQRVVFANPATELQRNMPVVANNIIRKLVADQALYNSEFKKLQDDGSMYMFGAAAPYMANGKPELGPGRAGLVVTSSASGLSANLYVNDAAGQHIIDGSKYLSLPRHEEPKPTPLGEAIAFAPVAKAYAKAIGERDRFSTTRGNITAMTVRNGKVAKFESSGAVPPPPNLPDGAKDAILHPDKIEPLAIAAQPLIERAFDGNLIAQLPDSAFGPLLAALATDKVTANQLRWYVGSADLTTTQDTGWTVLTPRFPLTEIQNRTVRTTLASLLQALDQQGYLRLAQLTTYAVSQPSSMQRGDVADALIGTLNPVSEPNAFRVLSEPAVLKVFGTMSIQQRSTLLNGSAISFAELSPQQRQWLTDEMMNSADGPREGIDGKLTRNVYRGQGMTYDRTETLAHGIPLSATMSLSFDSQVAALATNTQTGFKDFVTANRLAMQTYQGEQKNWPTLPAPPTYDLFQPAHMEHYTFNFHLVPPVMYMQDYDDFFTDPGSRAVAWTGLPESFRAQVDQELAGLREAFNQGFGNAGNRSTIPPR